MANSSRYLTSLAAIRQATDSAVLDLSSDELDFVMSNRLWLLGDRNRARRALESIVYGGLDVVGLPRFAIPAEFIAAGIALYVHPVNLQLACAIMDGFEWSENVIRGVERPVTAPELFAHVLQIRAGHTEYMEAAEIVATRILAIRGGV